MAALTVQSPAIVNGTVLTFNAASASDTFTNNSRVYIIVFNNSGATRTFDAVTIQVVETDLAVEDRSFSVANGAYLFIGTFNEGVYGTTVTITNWDATPTGVSIAVFSS